MVKKFFATYIDKDFYSTRPIDGDQQNSKQFYMMSGIVGSYLEGGIFEQFFDNDAISTIHILNAAYQQGITVYQIAADNAADILPKLDYDNDKLQILQNLIDSGKEITIPEREITINGWTGTGYIALDPDDGTGAYMIDGGTSGGKLSDLSIPDWASWSISWITVFLKTLPANIGAAIFNILLSVWAGITDTALLVEGRINTWEYTVLALLDATNLLLTVCAGILCIDLCMGFLVGTVVALCIIAVLSALMAYVHTKLIEKYLTGAMFNEKNNLWRYANFNRNSSWLFHTVCSYPVKCFS